MQSTGIVVLGARGSIPVSGPDFVEYGGHSTCFALVVNGLTVGFIDAGSGLTAYRRHGLHLAPTIGMFLTHYHWDHIQGLSMFDEIWRGGCDITVHGPGDPMAVLEGAIAPPLFPVTIADAQTINYKTIDEPVTFHGLTVSSFEVNHPQGGFGYVISSPDRSVAIVTDHEAGSPLDESIADAVRGVDVLFHDAQYLPAEMKDRTGWGHSTFESAAEFAASVDAGELILTSHDPGRTDEGVSAVVAEARGIFPATTAARAGLEVDL